MRNKMKLTTSARLFLISLLFVLITGCRSRVITVHLTNTSAEPLSIIEVSYPGGTFGKNSLAAGEAYRYTIKTLGEGTLKIQFTDAEGHTHSADGPGVKRSQEGSIEISLTQNSASAKANLQ
jgi:hypothetical protein